ncbi:hypothetical protein PHMEG_00016679 [Phytophthora megakarya]|uniref:Uncharacterized protein n=1 Tax=Phytophthora megakarya TaxID=4795 RepID=A0A225VYE3_9STRA|nr:hypothetical protein PHMEG_00016679 [Phytophthora megakarya]
MENASKWWLDMDRRMPERKRTWKNLKRALLPRYGEKLDKSTAEWRVNMRRMMPGETHADLAAGLRDVVGCNKVSEQVLLAQFYHNLDNPTKTLVKPKPKPRTLEEVVEKATEIDDSMDNEAQGMMNIGQSWATSPSRYFIPMDGTTRQMGVIPGVSGTGMDAMMTEGVDDVDSSSTRAAALFTSPQGVYKAYSGTWDPPPDHTWNDKYWYEPRETARKTAAAASTASIQMESKRTAVNAKPSLEQTVSSGEEPDDKPRKIRLKTTVKKTTDPKKRDQETSVGQRRVSADGSKCFACNQ